MPGKDSFHADDNQSMQYTYQGITLYIPKIKIKLFLFVPNVSMFHSSYEALNLANNYKILVAVFL